LFFEFLTPISWRWAVVLLLVGVFTALVGVYYALFSRNLRQVLAYHSLQNMGVILVGIGVALVFSSEQLKAGLVNNLIPVSHVAGLALVASLYHTFNHSIFKTLLILSAGSIERQTGTLAIDSIGGLLRQLPWAGSAFLVGTLAIIGLPPLNGFISNWLIIQSFFAGWAVFHPQTDAGLTRIAPWLMMILPFSLLLLTTSLAITALAFVRLAGEILLGRGRTPNLRRPVQQSRTPWPIRVVLLVFVGLCLLLGLLPVCFVPWLKLTALSLGHPAEILQATAGYLVIQWQPTELPVAVLPILLVVGLLFPFGIGGGAFFWHKHRPVDRGPLWQGGENYDSRINPQVAGTLPSLFGRAESFHTLPDQPLSYQLAPGQPVIEIFNGLYNAVIKRLLWGSNQFGSWFQNGQVERYLVYIFGVIALILLVLIVVTR
jgi:formate hydrogenlyase subunit 3/multisubunit Na+/H+ antiporter MnhD subunit